MGWGWAPRSGRTLRPGKTRYPFYTRLGGSQGRSGRAENLVSTGSPSPQSVDKVQESLYNIILHTRTLTCLLQNGLIKVPTHVTHPLKDNCQYQPADPHKRYRRLLLKTDSRHCKIGLSLVRFQIVSMEFFIDIKSFRSHYDPGVDSASKRNEYQEHFLGVKTVGA